MSKKHANADKLHTSILFFNLSPHSLLLLRSVSILKRQISFGRLRTGLLGRRRPRVLCVEQARVVVDVRSQIEGRPPGLGRGVRRLGARPRWLGLFVAPRQRPRLRIVRPQRPGLGTPGTFTDRRGGGQRPHAGWGSFAARRPGWFLALTPRRRHDARQETGGTADGRP